MRRIIGLVTPLVALLCLSGSIAPQAAAQNDRERIVVYDMGQLRSVIGLDNMDIVLDPGGTFIQTSCAEGVPEETEETDDTCGQMHQGDNSVLRSTLELQLDENKVPTGVVLTPGAVIDCQGLPVGSSNPNGLSPNSFGVARPGLGSASSLPWILTSEMGPVIPVRHESVADKISVDSCTRERSILQKERNLAGTSAGRSYGHAPLGPAELAIPES